MSEPVPHPPDAAGVVVTRRKRKHAGDPERMTAIPTWIYWLLGGVLLALLAIVVLLEPWLHREQIPYNHPPGTAPLLTPTRR